MVMLLRGNKVFNQKVWTIPDSLLPISFRCPIVPQKGPFVNARRLWYNASTEHIKQYFAKHS